jgi:phosphoglycolate phosphatase
MAYEFLVFDLDGTLSDPKEGILHATNFALAAYGYAPVQSDAVDAYIGPPLDFAFKQITGSKDEAHIGAVIAKYREAYARTGYAENRLYPGIASLLEILSQENVKLGVCTSKRVDFAESILKLHRIRHYFTFVDGGDVGIPKYRQLHKLIKKGVLSEKAVMIGDRDIDLVAARRNGLASAGVLWGYGSRLELTRENPTHLFEEPGQLVELADWKG